jgi:hypothetical protein
MKFVVLLVFLSLSGKHLIENFKSLPEKITRL